MHPSRRFSFQHCCSIVEVAVTHVNTNDAFMDKSAVKAVKAVYVQHGTRFIGKETGWRVVG